MTFMIPKKALFYFICIFCLCLLEGCNFISNNGSGNDPDQPTIDLKKVESNLKTVSGVISEAIAKKPILATIINDKINERFDGETEVLYMDIAGIDTGDGTTIHDTLVKTSKNINCENRTKNVYGSGSGSFENAVNELSQVMNLQIYMPNSDKWNGTDIPLVTYIPVMCDPDEIDELAAIDPKGNAVTVTEANYMDRPLFIIGPNERTNNKAELRTDLIYENKNQTMQSIGQTINPGVVTVRDGGVEYIKSMTIYDEHESWTNGSPEYVVNWKFSKAAAAEEPLKFNDTFDDSIGKTVEFKNKQSLGPWFEDDRGTVLTMFMYEDDPDFGTISFALNAAMEILKVHPNLSIKGETKYEIKLGAHDDRMGAVYVCYYDPSGKVYPGIWDDNKEWDITLTYDEAAQKIPTDKPIPQSPIGTVGTMYPRFRWTSVPGAAAYSVYVKRTSDDFLLQQGLGIDGTEYTYPDPLPANVQLYWTVCARDTHGKNYQMSDKANFIVNTGNNTTPAKFKISGGNMPSFTWPEGAPYYWLLVSDNPDVGSGKWLIDERDWNTNTYGSNIIFPPGTYYWKVKYKAGDFSVWYWSKIMPYTIE